PEIGLLTQLRKLTLSLNQLTELPEEVGRLTELTDLELDRNQFTALPRVIGQLSKLKYLSLHTNAIKEIPPEIGQLRMLENLNLQDNHLTALPPEIGQLAQLGMLSLGSNHLTALPPEIGQLAQLGILHVNHNQLRALPPEVGQLTQLRSFATQGNPDLAELPLSLGTIPGITYLDIYDTRIPQRVANALLASTRALRDREADSDLPRRLGVWKAALDAEAPALAHIEDFEVSEKLSINEWLTRLEKCPDFRGNQKEMARIVLGILESLKNHPEFKEQFFAQVETNLGCCEDRAAMSLNEIYTAYLIATTENPPLELLAGVAKTLALRKVVMGALAGTEGQGESVEIYLRHETALRERLGLVTAIQSGRYTDIGRDLPENALIAAVESNYLDELFDLPIFQTIAEKDPGYRESYERIRAQFTDKQEEIAKGLSDQAHKNQSDQLKYEFNQAVRDLQRNWLQTKNIQPSR
ncbi:MAG: hypothetical protein KDK48_02790, partial [Chlamydiia bacterium]|nr:hypothetical protein [Chlamydiia bacterium]